MSIQEDERKKYEQFDHPPIVEIIAELRCSLAEFPPILNSAPGTQITYPIASFERHEKMLKNFTNRVASLGYNQFERVVPEGFPLLPFQPVCRYRKDRSVSDSTLYQVGTGIFSTNVVPPYQTWQDFRLL